MAHKQGSAVSLIAKGLLVNQGVSFGTKMLSGKPLSDADTWGLGLALLFHLLASD